MSQNEQPLEDYTLPSAPLNTAGVQSNEGVPSFDLMNPYGGYNGDYTQISSYGGYGDFGHYGGYGPVSYERDAHTSIFFPFFGFPFFGAPFFPFFRPFPFFPRRFF